MKRLLVFIIAMCLFISCGAIAFASDNTAETESKTQLSSLDNAELYEALNNLGVTIPDELSDTTKEYLLNGGLKEIVEILEDDPNHFDSIAINYTVASDFYKEIRYAIERYYGTQSNTYNTLALQYKLEHSTLYSWDASTMKKYNCYSYVLGKTTAIYNPGAFSNQYYDDSASISALANLVKDDLNGQLNYKCVKIQTSRPSSTTGWANVIAVRKDTDRDFANINDYHFAKLTSSGWYHKPGKTAILKFNNAPTNSEKWTNENYDGTYNKGLIEYDSDLRFILYKSNHGSTTYKWTGKHNHVGSKHNFVYAYVCNDCGDYVSTVTVTVACSGPPCALPASLPNVPEIK